MSNDELEQKYGEAYKQAKSELDGLSQEELMAKFMSTAAEALQTIEELKNNIKSINHFAFGIVDKTGRPYLKNGQIAEDREALDNLVEYLNEIPQQPDSKYIQPFKVVELVWSNENVN